MHTRLNTINVNNFLSLADAAIENHLAFANFVKEAEILCDHGKNDIIDENLARYREIWFDLEVINALALDDWESAGKPENWLTQWESNYKCDAMDEIVALRALLVNL